MEKLNYKKPQNQSNPNSRYETRSKNNDIKKITKTSHTIDPIAVGIKFADK